MLGYSSQQHTTHDYTCLLSAGNNNAMSWTNVQQYDVQHIVMHDALTRPDIMLGVDWISKL